MKYLKLFYLPLLLAACSLQLMAQDTKRIYLKQNNTWSTDNAKSAIFADNKWSWMIAGTDCEAGYLVADIPATCGLVVFGRFNPSTTGLPENGWNNGYDGNPWGFWGQTIDFHCSENNQFTTTNWYDGKVGGNVSIFALPSRTITYHKGLGGHGTMENTTFTCGDDVTLSTCTFYQDGYYFAGWKIQEQGGEIVYQDGQTIENLTTNLNLYAYWKNDAYFLYADFEDINYKHYLITDDMKFTLEGQNAEGTRYYNFKIKYGSGQDATWYGPQHVLSDYRISDDEWTMDAIGYSGCNVQLYPQLPGEYTFHIDCSGTYPVIRISYPPYTVAVGDAGYNTAYFPYATTIPTGVTAYVGSVNAANTEFQLTQVEEVIPTNTPVVIKADKGTYTFVSHAPVDGLEVDNDLRGVLVETPRTALAEQFGADNLYFLGTKDGVIGFRHSADLSTPLKANRAYLVCNAPAGAALRIVLPNTNMPIATGVESMTSIKTGKLLRNGNIYIVREGKMFDLNGRELFNL